MNAGRVRIDFEAPADGWMDVRITLGDAVVRLEASVVHDVVVALTEVGVALMTGRAPTPVTFDAERDTSVLAFTPHGETVEIAVRRGRGWGAENDALLVAVAAPRRVVARAIWTALRRLEGAYPPAELRRRWAAFPARDCAWLGAALRDAAGPG